MSTLRLLGLRLSLLWSLGHFGAQIAFALVASQRVLMVVVLVVVAIGVSTSISHSLIVGTVHDRALATPPPALLAQTITDPTVRPTSLQQLEANQLWNGYKQLLLEHSHNRNLLANLILLASALDLKKDVLVYQRQLYLSDPLLTCTFSNTSDGRLQIDCPTPLL